MESQPTILTSLGTSDYHQVTYEHNGKRCCTNMLPQALAEWFSPTEMIVLLTPEAETHQNWQCLRDAVPCCRPVQIPRGQTEDELWEIFDTITRNVGESGDIIFDITHAFRSLPTLVLLAAAYLKEARSLNLQGILYGAFAANADGVAPVFDLTPFLSLLEWAVAANRFVETGDCKPLGGLLKDTHERLRHACQVPGDGPLPTQLQTCGNRLDDLSRALALARPKDVAESSKMLLGALRSGNNELTMYARPFTLLADKIGSQFAQFELGDLQAQRELIQWYACRTRILETVTLAREWLISWTAWQLRCEKRERNDVEKAVNAFTHGDKDVDDLVDAVSLLRQSLLLKNVWKQVSDLRNDAAHCGFRKNPRPARKLAFKALKVVEQLREFSL